MKLYFVTGVSGVLQWDRERGFSDDHPPMKILPEVKEVWVFDRPMIREDIEAPFGYYDCATIEADAIEAARFTGRSR